MKTDLVKPNSHSFEDLCDEEIIIKAAGLINGGHLVGFPTETVYGLGASVFSESAIKKIFTVKGRPQDNPLIVHISNLDMLNVLVKDIPNKIKILCNSLWPGPITILFNKSPKVPSIVTAGLETIAIRMPSNPIALALIECSNVPIAAPSANLSGFPSPTRAQHVYNDLKGKIPLVLDGGSCDIGVESTVIDTFQDPPVVLRPGGMEYEQLLQYIPNLKIYSKIKSANELIEKPSSPGMKYRHYSPKAQVILVNGTHEEMKSKIISIIDEFKRLNKKIGLIHTHSYDDIDEIFLKEEKYMIIRLLENDSRFSQSEIVARGIFTALRDMDDKKMDIIIVESISEKERGLAVMNRLNKAASRTL